MFGTKVSKATGNYFVPGNQVVWTVQRKATMAPKNCIILGCGCLSILHHYPFSEHLRKSLFIEERVLSMFLLNLS